VNISPFWIAVLRLLLCFSFAGAPTFGYWHHGYGWYPSGGGGIVLLIILVLLFTGRL
jgi:hypothetical protein